MPVGEVAVTSVVPLSVEATFAAFTDEIDRWWQRTPTHDRDTIIRFEGDQLVAVSSAGSEMLATIASWDPPNRVELNWHGPHAKAGDTVAIEFAPELPGTRVTIRHRRDGLLPEAVESAVVGLWWGDLVGRLVHAHRL